MFQRETVSFRGHFPMANKPDYNFFKFFDIPQEPRRPNEVKRASLEFTEQKEVVVRSLTGSKYLLAMEDLIHERSHPDVLDESEGETERKKIYFKKNTVDAFLPEMVAFFQYSNSNFMKDVYEERQIIRRDDCLIESFGENDLESSSELSSREMQDSMSSRQNESISEDERIKQHVYENSVAETKEIPDDFDHPEAKTVNQPRPVIDLESSTDDKRESLPEADQHESSESNFQAENRIEEIRKSHVDQRQCGPKESRAIVSETCSCQTKGKEPLQHCCNGSVRSTNSHASSRSFSFPIFPLEWTGSPVRIPDSGRRKLRLHRRRRVRIFCCKF